MSMRSSLPQGFFFKSSVVSVVSASNRSVFVCFRPNCIPLPLSAWKAPGISAAEVSFAIRPSFGMLVLTRFSKRLPAAGLMVLCRSDAASLQFSQVMRLISRNDAHPFTQRCYCPTSKCACSACGAVDQVARNWQITRRCIASIHCFSIGLGVGCQQYSLMIYNQKK